VSCYFFETNNALLFRFISSYDISPLSIKLVLTPPLKQRYRYIVVIDDVWTKKDLKPIMIALQKSSKESIIITTTRIHNVSEAFRSSHGAYVYKMSPLSRVDSRKLLLRRIFGSEDKCPAQLNQVCDEILRKCEVLPFAISSISGLLINNNPKRKGEWDKVNKSIGRALEKKSRG
jgi:hypothetical protein